MVYGLWIMDVPKILLFAMHCPVISEMKKLSIVRTSAGCVYSVKCIVRYAVPKDSDLSAVRGSTPNRCCYPSRTVFVFLFEFGDATYLHQPLILSE